MCYNRDTRLDGPDWGSVSRECNDCDDKEKSKKNGCEFLEEVIDQLFKIKECDEHLLNTALFELASYFDDEKMMKICDSKKLREFK